MSITIRQYQQEDKETVLSLHRAAFERRSGNNYGFFLEELIHELTAGFCVVATDNDRVIGAGTYTPLKSAFSYPHDYSLQESFQRLVTLATDPTKKEELIKYLRYEYGWAEEAEIEVEYFRNAFPSEKSLVNENDLYLSGVAVHPAFRGKGIGTAISERRIDIARQQGATALYASCYESSKSHIMFKKLDFLPFIRAGPKDAEESAIIEMRIEL